MRITFTASAALALPALLAVSAPAFGQQDELPPAPTFGQPITVEGAPPADLSGLAEGPDIVGTISARNGDRMRIRGADATSTVVAISEGTEIRSRGGFLGMGGGRLGAESLLNGLPVTIETVQWGDALVAKKVRLRSGDLRTAAMIRDGTEQGFAEQTAATAALRSRVGDIDNYNIVGTTNVYFDTARWQLSPQARNDLCAAAGQAAATDNALLLVVGYTDSVGDEDYNQELSERRAGSVINYLQQQCRWQPWRVLTPTGMSESDPTADNGTPEGRAQNRRVSVNILVSKAVDGL